MRDKSVCLVRGNREEVVVYVIFLRSDGIGKVCRSLGLSQAPLLLQALRFSLHGFLASVFLEEIGIRNADGVQDGKTGKESQMNQDK